MLKRAPTVCQSCGAEFTPKRPWQGYCSETCANRDRQKRRRQAGKCRDSTLAVSLATKCRDTAQATPQTPPPAKPETLPPPQSYGWGKPGETAVKVKAEAETYLPMPDDPPLVGDDYPIEMDADGYPIMPACLRRRKLNSGERTDG